MSDCHYMRHIESLERYSLDIANSHYMRHIGIIEICLTVDILPILGDREDSRYMTQMDHIDRY